MHIRKRSLRFSGIFLSLIFCLLLFSLRLVYLQFLQSDRLADLAQKQQSHSIKLDPVRGTIFDRRMRPLALNVPVYSLYANPRAMSPEDKDKAVDALSGILSLSPNFLRDRLDRKKYFIWLARKISLEKTQNVKKLNIKGLSFIKESTRHYPNKYLAAQLIGFSGMDNVGLEGLERLYDKLLRGQPGWSQILRDARQRELLIEKEFIPPKDGFSLILTIDETIQYLAEAALEKAFIKHNAKSASIVIMNPKTGEILAMANRPTYDLSEFSTSKPESRINRSIALVFEPGSVFKFITAAAALEESMFTEEDTIFCEHGTYRVGGRILHDHHSYGNLSFREVFEKSSNIGATKIAQRLGNNIFYSYARKFQFGRRTKIDLLGEVPGLLKPPSKWSKTTITAMPMGHEITATPLQLACAISTIANDGVFMKPFVVKYIKDNNDELIQSSEPKVVERVISRKTAERVKAILTGVVDVGTGQRAKIDNMKVAGKTGTAQKVIDGQYSHSKFFASFIGFAPADNPRIAVVVTFDEPHPHYYGGTVAAPVFKEVVVDVLKYLNSNGG